MQCDFYLLGSAPHFVQYFTNCISKATFSFAVQSKDEYTSYRYVFNPVYRRASL